MGIEKQSNAIKGGKREGAGRKSGVPNKRTAETVAKVEASGLTPLEYLLGVMRDCMNDPKDRASAAVAAAPYVHAKLSSIDANVRHSGEIGVDVNVHFD